MYNVNVTNKADEDIASHARYIYEVLCNGDAAYKLVEEFETLTMEKLINQPKGYTIYPCDDEEEYRRASLLNGSYWVYFTIVGDIVTVAFVLHDLQSVNSRLSVYS